MTTSAIQQDVPTNPESDDTTVKREPTAREQAMDLIAAGRNAEFEKETGIKIEAFTPDPDVDPADAEAETARLAAEKSGEQTATPAIDQLAQQLETSATVAADDLPSRKVKVKIDGVESEVSIEEMQREYQKGRTADKRLAEAAEQRRLLQEEQLAAQTRSATPTAVEVDPAVAKKFTSALFGGDEDMATAAFAEALSTAVQAEMAKTGRSNATQPDAQTIAQQVKQQLDFESALKQSKQDYPQLYADPDLEALGASKIQRRMNDEGMSFADALQSVGTEFSTKFGWKTAGRPDATTSTMTRDAKLERKAAIDNVSGINVKSTTTEEPPKTSSDIIAEIARARGQAV